MNRWKIIVPLLTSALVVMWSDFRLVSTIVKGYGQGTRAVRSGIGREADKRFSWVGVEEIFFDTSHL